MMARDVRGLTSQSVRGRGRGRKVVGSNGHGTKRATNNGCLRSRDRTTLATILRRLDWRCEDIIFARLASEVEDGGARGEVRYQRRSSNGSMSTHTRPAPRAFLARSVAPSPEPMFC
jgi:hypothetical protein